MILYIYISISPTVLSYTQLDRFFPSFDFNFAMSTNIPGGYSSCDRELGVLWVCGVNTEMWVKLRKNQLEVGNHHLKIGLKYPIFTSLNKGKV